MKALALKYRPKTFEDVCEQSSIKAILEYQISSNTQKHAYLLCGPAGTGKTTLARIFANVLNNGKGSPIELDAASNNGVDDVRQIISDAQKRPLDCAYKVFILDEVHMLSTAGWNALLKLLEEPPATALFIMCTTDPQKIPATIISRTQTYNLSKISTDTIIDRLEYIINKENKDSDNAITYEQEAISYIAKLSEGGMRDAITMLDKCISLSTKLSVLNVIKALGVANYATYFELLYSLNTNAQQPALKIIDEVFNSGKDLKQFMKQFQNFVTDVCKYHIFKDFKYVSIPNIPEYVEKLGDEDIDECVATLEWCRELNTVIKWENGAKSIVDMNIVLKNKPGEK